MGSNFHWYSYKVYLVNFIGKWKVLQNVSSERHANNLLMPSSEKRSFQWS